jgi:phospholipase C
MWLVCPCTPVFPNAPEKIVARPVFDTQGTLVDRVKDGDVTPDGFAVNNLDSVFHPHDPTYPADELVPPQTAPTIGDRLSAANVSWAWYAGGWDDALAGKPDKLFEFHHQPFVYFANFGDGTAAKATHLKDEKDFLESLTQETLPAVSFIKPLSRYDEHAGYTDIRSSEQHAVELIERVRASPYWKDSAIIVTYDDFGGWYDHVPPPKVDRWGPGGRIPAIIISPYAKKGFVDRTPYDTTSILKLIETRWNLPPLGTRDAGANDMTHAFDFTPIPSPPQ